MMEIQIFQEYSWYLICSRSFALKLSGGLFYLIFNENTPYFGSPVSRLDRL